MDFTALNEWMLRNKSTAFDVSNPKEFLKLFLSGISVSDELINWPAKIFYYFEKSKKSEIFSSDPLK